jgi:hypothetical protein
LSFSYNCCCFYYKINRVQLNSRMKLYLRIYSICTLFLFLWIGISIVHFIWSFRRVDF